MAESKKAPYSGDVKKLIVSVDIGTTFTAVSFSILDPGEPPQFHEIMRWPKQALPDAKVPSVVFYDADGAARAFGAETEDDDVLVDAEDEQWAKAEWWKLHLRPTHLPMIKGLVLPPLPHGTSVDKVFADYLGYVREQLQAHITTVYADGAQIWSALWSSMEVILTTPNGWEITQQQYMRAAAQKAGLVAGHQAAERVRFVTEAEAAILYAIDSGCIGEWLKRGAHLVLCDCGGGTVDIASYKITELGPLRLEETAAAGCYLAGAIFVNEECKNHMKKYLKGTEWASDEAIARALQHFDKNAKKKFEGLEMTSWVELGGFKSVPSLGITRGKLKLAGPVVAGFFAKSLQHIKEGLDKACSTGQSQAKKVILVGGLASSPYVYSELQAWGQQRGVSVSRPDGPTTKAVANGALAFYLQMNVTARINKYNYGVYTRVLWSESDPETKSRARYIDETGRWMVNGAWGSIVGKDVRIEGGHEYSQPFWFTMGPNESNTVRKCDIYVYRWDQPSRFVEYPGTNKRYPGFEILCSVEADLRAPYVAAPLQIGQRDKRFKTVKFDLCLTFGATELTARLRWKEKDIFQYGRATIAHRPLTGDAS